MRRRHRPDDLRRLPVAGARSRRPPARAPGWPPERRCPGWPCALPAVACPSRCSSELYPAPLAAAAPLRPAGRPGLLPAGARRGAPGAALGSVSRLRRRGAPAPGAGDPGGHRPLRLGAGGPGGGDQRRQAPRPLVHRSGRSSASSSFAPWRPLVVAAARRAPRPRRPSLRLALANIHRRGSPAGSAVFSLGLGLTALVIVALVQANLTRLVDETIPAEAPAFFFLDIQPDQVAPFTALVDSSPASRRSERYPTLRGRIVAIAGVPVDKAHIAPGVEWAVRGDRWLSYAAEMPADTRLTAGNWWPADYHGPPLLSLTADLAKGLRGRGRRHPDGQRPGPRDHRPHRQPARGRLVDPRSQLRPPLLAGGSGERPADPHRQRLRASRPGAGGLSSGDRPLSQRLGHRRARGARQASPGPWRGSPTPSGRWRRWRFSAAFWSWPARSPPTSTGASATR